MGQRPQAPHYMFAEPTPVLCGVSSLQAVGQQPLGLPAMFAEPTPAICNASDSCSEAPGSVHQSSARSMGSVGSRSNSSITGSLGGSFMLGSAETHARSMGSKRSRSDGSVSPSSALSSARSMGTSSTLGSLSNSRATPRSPVSTAPGKGSMSSADGTKAPSNAPAKRHVVPPYRPVRQGAPAGQQAAAGSTHSAAGEQQRGHMPSLDEVVWFLHVQKQVKLRRKGSQQLPEQQEIPAANSSAHAFGRVPVLDLANLPSQGSEGCLERRDSLMTSRFTARPSQASARTMGSSGTKSSTASTKVTCSQPAAAPFHTSARTLGSTGSKGSAKTSCSQAAASVPQPMPKNKKHPAVLVRSFYMLSHSLQPCRPDPAGPSLASALPHLLSLCTCAPPSEPSHTYICVQ